MESTATRTSDLCMSNQPCRVTEDDNRRSMIDDDRLSLITSAVHQSSLPVVVTTPDLSAPNGPEIVCVNDAYEVLTGHSREELIGNTPRIHQGAGTDRHVLDRLRLCLGSGVGFEGQTWNYRKDGTPYLVEWTVSPLRLWGGKTDYFVSVQRDITTGQSSSLSPIHLLDTSVHAVRNDSDPVTGSQNKASMLESVQQKIDSSQENPERVGLIMLKLKQLRRINKVFSLESIRELLWEISQCIAINSRPGETIARPHEHTIAITVELDREAEKEGADYLSKRAYDLCNTVMSRDFVVSDEIVDVEIGCGVGLASQSISTAKDLAVLTDEAAQKAARKGQAEVVWADRSIIDNESRQIEIERDLRRAIYNDEIIPYYQPIIDLDSGCIIGAEALARWIRPEGKSPIGPDEFIPIAESIGIIDRMGRRVLEKAASNLYQWQKHLDAPSFWISINIAPQQLLDQNLPDRLLAIARSMGVSAESIKLEITESALEYDFSTVQCVIDDLVESGFLLALDDFGKGHSSLERVISLPFSSIKVDKSFVWQVVDGPGRAVVSSVANLAQNLDMYIIGEGVESADHEAMLREYNYEYAQGFYYGRPMSAEDLTELMRERNAATVDIS